MPVDMDGMRSMRDAIRRLQTQLDSHLADYLLELGLKALVKTKRRTPVDTGALRRAWALSDVHRQGNDLVIELFNTMDYASYVEYGHTTRDRMGWVEGYFMCTVSIQEVENEMQKEFDRKFALILKEIGIL
ncbi:MAG: HK97 gp10 family phage protein [Oscillospiraceae bacterium]